MQLHALTIKALRNRAAAHAVFSDQWQSEDGFRFTAWMHQTAGKAIEAVAIDGTLPALKGCKDAIDALDFHLYLSSGPAISTEERTAIENDLRIALCRPASHAFQA